MVETKFQRPEKNSCHVPFSTQFMHGLSFIVSFPALFTFQGKQNRVIEDKEQGD